MRILFLTAVMYPQGTWYRVLNLATSLQRRGHSLSIVKTSVDRLRPKREQIEGVTVWNVPRLWGSSLFEQGTRMPWDVAARLGLLALKSYDVIHGFTHYFNCLFPALVARHARPCLVVGDRDDLWTDGGLAGKGKEGSALKRLNFKFNAWTEQNMGAWLGTMTVVSDDLAQRLLVRGVDGSRVRKIINGCPTRRIVPGDRMTARRLVGLPVDRPVLLFIGVGQYDVDLILDALSLLNRAGPRDRSPLTLLIGPHEDRLRAMAEERGLGDQVIATGALSEPQLLPYLQAADVGLLPFADKPLNWARFPIKLGDYLAAGLPVLTNDVGEMGRIVRETGAGEVTAPDPQSYAAGMARMLSHPSKLSEYRSRAQAAAEQMSWDIIGRDLEQFYIDMGARH